jgi:hypothetical protein
MDGFIRKSDRSTFFPDGWSKQKIHEELAFAYSTKYGVGPNKYIGVMSNGVDIVFYVKNGKITTAYPSIPNL